MSNHFEVTQLTKNIWAIRESIVCCFLVEGSEKAALLDCCMSKSTDVAEIVKGLTNKPVDLVFTHTDPDHTGGQDGFGIPFLHPSEYDYYYSKGNAGRDMRPLWEGDVLDLGGVCLEVVLIPGHTPGSIALLDRTGRRLFVGDTVSDFWVYLFGNGRNLRAFIESLEKLERMADVFDVVHPCHGTSELSVEWVAKVHTAAELLRAGALEGVDPPQDLPCKAYKHEGVTLLY